MVGEEEKNGNGLNITIGVDLAPMMRMVVVMMVMKLVEVVGNLKKGRKMNQTSNYEANSRQRYMCSLGYPKKTLMLNFAMVKKSRHRFCDEDIDRCGSNWSKGTKCAILTPKFGYFGLNVNFLFWNCDFCQQGILPKKNAKIYLFWKRALVCLHNFSRSCQEHL